MSDLVRVRYEELEKIADCFDNEAQEILEMRLQWQRECQDLLEDGWKGKAAERFAQLMEQDIFRALRRLEGALTDAGHTTNEVISLFQQAEEESAGRFDWSSEEGRQQLAAAINRRIEELTNAGITPDNSDLYNAEWAVGTVFLDPKNRVAIEQIAAKYGIDPALLAGVIAAEMDFDYEYQDKIQDGLGRRGLAAGQGQGLGNVHTDTLEAAIEYLGKHQLPGTTDAASYDWDVENRSSFNGSVEAAAIAVTMYADLHGPIDSAEDMAVIWGAYRTGIQGVSPGDKYGFESLEAYQGHVARGTTTYAPQFQVGSNAYMSQPYFEYFMQLFAYEPG
jgi:WXG100 family type VII secretion target